MSLYPSLEDMAVAKHVSVFTSYILILYFLIFSFQFTLFTSF